MTDETTLRDLARIGDRIGDDGRLFEIAMRALASSPHDFGSDEHLEFTAAQIYDAAPRADPSDAAEYVNVLRDALDMDTLEDANAVLSRNDLRENYAGQLAFV